MTPFTPAEQEKFEKIKKLVFGVVKRMDNSKQLNVKRYEDLFKMFENNPDLFRNWEVLHDESLDSTIQLFALPFEEVRMPQIKNAADFLGIPLEEYIYYRFNGQEPIRSKMEVPVGFVHIKRVQQILSKKNHYSLDNEERSLKTNQVKGESKCASLSDVEAFALAAIGADNAMKEFLGARSDNEQAKLAMYRQIARDGYTTLEDITPKEITSTTVNTLNTYLLASGIRSDLINNSLKTNFTIEQDLRK